MLEDREVAGHALALALARFRPGRGALVLGVARGGVVVASVVSRELGLPLDVYVSVHLSSGSRPRGPYGAVTEDGTAFVDDLVARVAGVPHEAQEAELRRRREQARWAARLYRGGRPAPRFEDRTLIVIDDGIASGLTLLAAVEALRRQRPRRLIAAVPVGPVRILLELQEKVDALFALACPVALNRVEDAYDRFPAVSHREVLRRLAAGHAPRRWSPAAPLAPTS